MTGNPTGASLAHADIYELAITLRYLLVERDALGEGVAAGLWVCTVEDATRQLSELVARWPGAAMEAVAFLEECAAPGLFYATVISTLRSMLARERGNVLLAEM